MTTKTGTVDFEYKEGVSDTVGVVLKQNGAAIDLTDYSIVFNIKDNSNHRFSVPCSLGSTVNGVEYTAEHGGCTIEFAAEHLAIVGEFNGEFVGTLAGKEVIIPNGEEYLVVMIYEAI